MNAHLQTVQHQFAAHIRNPDGNPPPSGIEERRLKIYRDLFYSNMESFLRQGFPVLHALLSARTLWHPLVKRFFAEHSSRSPYFIDIPREFLGYISALANSPPYPRYMVELAHYEWMELVLAVSTGSIDESLIEADGDLLAGSPVLNPVHRLLRYQWPVTQIGTNHEPAAPLSTPMDVLLFRNRGNNVRFLEINTVTRQLIIQLQQQPERTGAEQLAALAIQLPALDKHHILYFGGQLLRDFRSQEFILGTLRCPAYPATITRSKPCPVSNL